MPPWFRFYSEAITDRKIDRICRVLEQPKALIVGSWAILMAIGSDSPVRGVLLLTENIAFTDKDLADELGLDLDATQAILNQFQRFNMLHRDNGVIYLTNWDKRQFASDDSAERVRRYRERQQAEPEQECNDDVTLQDSDGNAPDQNRTDTDTEHILTSGEDAGPDGPVTFADWQQLVENPPEGSNRQAVLVRMHESLYPGRDPPSFGYVGKVAKGVGGAGRLAELLWQNSTRPPTGDVLAYVQGVAKGDKKRGTNSNGIVDIQGHRPTAATPEEFYGTEAG